MIRFAVRFAALFVAVGFALRLFMAAGMDDVPYTVWTWGFVSDLAALAMLGALTGLALLIPATAGRRFAVGVIVAVILIVAAAEAFFWIEFESRLDRLVFHYLAYPVEVLAFLEEQFFLTWGLIPFIGLVWLIVRWLAPPQAGWPVWSIVVLGLLVGLIFRQPTLGPSRYVNQAASNGYVGVLSAATLDVEDPGVLFADTSRPLPERWPQATAESPTTGARHLVMIIEESLAGPLWQNPDRRAQLLPNLTALAAQGVSFSNAYATGSRTTRGMEAILNGYPPLPGISTTERAGFERLPSLARALANAGFHTVFTYGGWPDFSNFTRYWRGTGFAETTSRHDFGDEGFQTSWGFPDDVVFERLLQTMDARTTTHERVFAAMLTVSHHRPFDLPPESPFAEGRSSENALRYADAALGRFFAAAEQKPWYADTLFVIVADHGPRASGEMLIPVPSFAVPLILVSRDLAPVEIQRTVSTMFLPKTLTRMLGVSHDEAFWGADLFATTPTVAPVEHGYRIGWIGDDAFSVQLPDGRSYTWPLGGGEAEAGAEIEALTDYFRLAHRTFYQAAQ